MNSGNAVTLIYDDIDSGAQPALRVNGNLSIGGNAFTVNTVNSQPLASGQYVLIQATGTATGSGSYPPVAGTAIGATSLGTISVSGTQVLLTVSSVSTVPPTMTFSRSGNTLTFSWPADHPRILPAKQFN